jgi:uncharacterized membrane protein
MRNYVAVVFSETNKAYEGLHELWLLDDREDITVHGTAVVYRDPLGQFQVASKETHPALATAIGVGVGALLGAFAGPAGIALGVAAGAGLGAATGGLVGALADVGRADTRSQALSEASFVLGVGQAAVIADVSESFSVYLDDRMKALGGTVYRRAKSDVRNDNTWFADSYLYPYEFVPDRAYWSH